MLPFMSVTTGQSLNLPRSTSCSQSAQAAYYIANNVTLGTGVARTGTTSASFSDTVAFFTMQNTDQASNPNGKSCYLDTLRLMITIVSASVTIYHLAVKKGTTNRMFTTAGTV